MKKTNTAELLDTIKSIPQQHISFDELGRLIIRLENSQEIINREFTNNVTNLTPTASMLQNRLLHPSDRIIQKPVNEWCNELLSAIKTYSTQFNITEQAYKIAELFNNAALVFFSVGDIKRATDVCYAQINMFVTWTHTTKNTTFLKYIFQPWINLSRIDRAQGNYYACFRKLDVLSFPDNSEIIIAGFKLLTAPIIKALNQDIILNNVLKTCRVLEPIKTFLAAKHYEDLKNFIQLKNTQDYSLQMSVFQEALAIACANTGKITEALDLLHFCQLNSNPSLMHVFKLRELEIKNNLAYFDSIREDMLAIKQLAIRNLKSATLNVNDIAYSLHTAQLLKKSNLTEEFQHLSYACLESAVKINDEVLQAECLAEIYSCVNKEIIENQITRLYSHTLYPAARKKLAHGFPALTSLSPSNHHPLTDALFEQVITFSYATYS